MKQRHSLEAESGFNSKKKLRTFLEYEAEVTCPKQLANGPYPVI